MSTGPQTVRCPFCDQPLGTSPNGCPHCQASADWLDLGQALAFVRRRLEQWAKEGRIRNQQFQQIDALYRQQLEEWTAAMRRGQAVPAAVNLPPRSECFSCAAPVDPSDSHCSSCGMPVQTARVRSLRYLSLLCYEIKEHEEAGRLSLAQAHALLTITREHMAGLNQQLEKDRLPTVVLAEPPVKSVQVPKRRPRAVSPRPLWEVLLAPRTIQWLLALGGTLLVLGLVIWLWAQGIFENPLVVAVILGTGNAALMLGGWTAIYYTRYQMAGRALTLLACLVMPLNLWFYHANDLITLDGHLWVAALVISVLYAANALVLRDELFVYVLAGGLALTGLLILADMHKFWEIAAPATLLVVLGLIALHTERAFPEGEGPFSRLRFGRAFFRSGHALLGAGLLLLLGAQLFGWLHPALVKLWNLRAIEFLAEPPAIVTDRGLRLLALGLVLAGTYAYIYSDLVVRRVGGYIYLAAGTLLWAEVLLVLLLDLRVAEPMLIIILALTALAANLASHWIAGEDKRSRTVVPLGLVLSLLPVLLGVVLHYRAVYAPLSKLYPYEITWTHVGALILTALSCRVGAYLYRRTLLWVSVTYFFATAAATLVAAADLLWVLGVKPWEEQAPLIMVIPIGYLVAARLYRGHTPERPLVWVAHGATAVMLFSTLWIALQITPQVVEPVTGKTLNLLLAAFCAEAAVFYALAGVLGRQGFNVYLGTVMACAAIWQLLLYWEIRHEYYVLIFAAVGFVLLLGYRLAVLERFELTGLAGAAFQCANALMSLAFLASLLLALSRLSLSQAQLSRLAGDDEWRSPLQLLLSLLIELMVLSLVTAWLVQHQGWRRWYIIMAIAEGLLMFVILHRLALLSPWQKLEIFSVVLGLLLLVLGHLGLYREYREQERQSDLTSLSLLLGSLLAGLPLAIAVLYYRRPLPEALTGWRHEFHAPDEVGLLAVSVLLLGTGVIFRVKSTTLVGGALTVLYVVTLLAFIHVPEKMGTAALGMVIGGAILFIVGLLLSIYRDRLLMLPDKIKRREGIFRVLSWR